EHLRRWRGPAGGAAVQRRSPTVRHCGSSGARGCKGQAGEDLRQQLRRRADRGDRHQRLGATAGGEVGGVLWKAADVPDSGPRCFLRWSESVKRNLLAALMAGLLLAGCSQTQLAPTARIIGTNGLAQVGDLLFVTSTDRAELRALDLKATTRDFVRAPNPLEPLSIPVLNRPVNLVRDLRYDDSGQEVTGPYLYAQAEAAQEISIVGTDRVTQLVELARLPVPGVVTAIAARGPAAAGQPSTLYYAVVNGA